MSRAHLFLIVTGLTCAAILIVAIALSLLPRRLNDRLTRAPFLDCLVSYFTWVPWTVAAIACGWLGVGGSILGQIVALTLWCAGHELAHPRARAGPRIVKVLNRIVGRWRNHVAIWVTVCVLPVFLLIRAAEIIAYPFLVVLLNFPKYDQAEWVNCSRQKFDGLVGHDLIWCLYCDWMTGLYSLGAEMLRNVESFWCPIRFYEDKKCENCRVDFPDIENGWVKAGGTMADVTATLEQKYADGQREWFGHPARLTVRGKPAQ